MSRHRVLVLSIAASALVSLPAIVSSQELSPIEKTLSADLQRCPSQNAEKCHTAALQQFETSLRRELPTPNAAYWDKVLAVLKRHSSTLAAELRAAEKSATGATGNAASSSQSKMQACMNAGGTFAQCYYWVYHLGGLR